MKKLNTKGFSVVEGLLIFVIVGLIAGVGWYVVNNRSDSDNSYNSTNTTPSSTKSEITDSSKTFSVEYPNTWSKIPYEEPGTDGPTKPTPDWTKDTQPITLRNKDNQKAEVFIYGFTDVDTTIEKEINDIDKDQFNTYEKVTINGYKALKHTTDFVGPSEAEKYKDIEYRVLNGKDLVTLSFRESYSNNTTNNEYDFDASNLTQEFESIVNSIKFL